MSEQDNQQAEAQVYFGIEKLYVKDLSVEVPGGAEIFTLQEAPQIDIQLRTEGRNISEGIFESTLTGTVTARIGERTAFLVEVAQAGIFSIQNVPEEQLELFLAVHCPNVLFPYLREAVSQGVNHAGFPPVYLAPVSFEQLYLQQLQQQAEQAVAQ